MSRSHFFDHTPIGILGSLPEGLDDLDSTRGIDCDLSVTEIFIIFERSTVTVLDKIELSFSSVVVSFSVL